MNLPIMLAGAGLLLLFATMAAGGEAEEVEEPVVVKKPPWGRPTTPGPKPRVLPPTGSQQPRDVEQGTIVPDDKLEKLSAVGEPTVTIRAVL